MSTEIICDDALNWLKKQTSLPNVVTGICDFDEMPEKTTMNEYLAFYTDVLEEIFSKLQDNCYAIFIQTDRKYQKSWIDKSYITTKIAQKHRIKVIWHKIVLHRGVDSTDLHRPTYAHVLCYSRNGTTGAATPDVIPVSKRLYKNATPPLAAERALEFVEKYSTIKTVLDPFVGRGTIPVLAKKLGLDSIGIDIDPKQCEETKKILNL
jgi:hypothetical protein